MSKDAEQSPAEIAGRIFVVRGRRVMLDSTKRLNEQVRRNQDRFPGDFLIFLTDQEVMRLRSQFATLKLGRGEHRKFLPPPCQYHRPHGH